MYNKVHNYAVVLQDKIITRFGIKSLGGVYFLVQHSKHVIMV